VNCAVAEVDKSFGSGGVINVDGGSLPVVLTPFEDLVAAIADLAAENGVNPAIVVSETLEAAEKVLVEWVVGDGEVDW
jgi:hypothetical protein